MFCRISVVGLALLAALCLAPVIEAAEYEFIASSYLGEAGFNDAVVAACYKSDGTLVLAANLGPALRKKYGLNGNNAGCLMFLADQGRKLVALKGVAVKLADMALDEKENIYLAADSDGILKLSPDAAKLLWSAKPGAATRIDAGRDGHVACVAAGKVHIFSPDGKPLGSANGGQFLCDVCVDSASGTVIQTGFRNANAFDGKKKFPVQICYIHGHDYQGTKKWTNYDWSTDTNSDRFLNKPTNNMADSRGDRCAIGRDGKLYVTFQVAGGNHLFRYHPRDIMQPVKLAGGDQWNQMHNSRAEHKNFFARFEPGTGDFLAGQQFCGRKSDGKANYVATKNGNITADEAGRVYVVGVAAEGLPLTLNPGESMGTSGGFLLVMSPDLKKRLLCTRTNNGQGSCHTVDTLTTKTGTEIVFAGSEMTGGMFVKAALQDKAGNTEVPVEDGKKAKDAPKDAFYATLHLKE